MNENISERIKELVKNKKIFFITTKNLDYIRNSQEIRLLDEYAKSIIKIYSNKKTYPERILSIWHQILHMNLKKEDIVFIGFEPQLILPFFSKKFRDNIVISDFFISVYDTFICDRKKFSKNGLFAKMFHWMDEKTIRLSDYIITDTKAHTNFFIREFKGEIGKFETLYLKADETIYFPREKEKQEELKDKFVVLYFGSILPLQGVEIILDAIGLMAESKKVHFEIIGPIPAKYNKPNTPNVTYTRWLAQDKLAERIAAADLCLAGHFSGDIEKAKRTIPGKTYIYEMMKKPMILGDSEANHELFCEDENHFFVKMGDSKALVEKIESCAKVIGAEV